MDNLIHLHSIKNEARVDSRTLSEYLQNQHKAVIQLIDSYINNFEEFGRVTFKMRPFETDGGKQKQRVAFLNEDQAYLLLSFSRNTTHVRKLKVELIKAFSRFRRHKQIESDYLPFYHELHDEVKVLAEQAQQAGSSTHERIFHINFNKLINKAFNLESGQRAKLPDHLRVKVTTANVIASELLNNAIDNGMNHKQAYAHVKQGIIVFANAGSGLLEVV